LFRGSKSPFANNHASGLIPVLSCKRKLTPSGEHIGIMAQPIGFVVRNTQKEVKRCLKHFSGVSCVVAGLHFRPLCTGLDVYEEEQKASTGE
jgi:hypothetical protein